MKFFDKDKVTLRCWKLQGYKQKMFYQYRQKILLDTDNYFKGSHQPSAVWQFCGILRMLEKLHENQYVHGDICNENLVYYDSNGNDGYLID